MRVFKWEHLKLKACQELSGKFSLFRAGGNAQLLMIEQMNTDQTIHNWRDNAKAMRLKAWEHIESWDIRYSGKLFEIFPSIIPLKYQGKPFTCEYDEQGNWCLCFE